MEVAYRSLVSRCHSFAPAAAALQQHGQDSEYGHMTRTQKGARVQAGQHGQARALQHGRRVALFPGQHARRARQHGPRAQQLRQLRPGLRAQPPRQEAAGELRQRGQCSQRALHYCNARVLNTKVTSDPAQLSM